MSVLSIYAVFADADEAERIGRTVVEERLAACVNILGPVRSIYRWQGTIETADETAAIFKTSLIGRRRAGRAHRRRCTATTCRASSPGRSKRFSREYAEWVEDSVGRAD